MPSGFTVELKANFNTKEMAKMTMLAKRATVQRHLEIAAQRAETEMLRLFNRTVRTWVEKPQFYHSVELNTYGTIRVKVGTEDEYYKWVNEGTPAHEITALHAPILKFQRKSPKTQPGSLTSTSQIKYGEWTTVPAVWNRGIRPRDFTGQIRAIMKQRLPEIVAVELKVAR